MPSTKHILDPTVSHTLQNTTVKEFIEEYLPGSLVSERGTFVAFDYENHRYLIKPSKEGGTFSALCISLGYKVGERSYHGRCASLKEFVASHYSKEFTDEPPVFFADTLKEAVFGLVSFIYSGHNVEDFHKMLDQSSTPQYD